MPMNTHEPSLMKYLKPNKSDLTKEHDKFVYDLFMRKFRYDLRNPNQPYDQTYFEKNLFLITMHFRQNRFEAKDAKSLYDSSPIFTSFKSWYLDTVRKVMGPRANKEMNDQPFTLASFDVEGTAQGATATVFQKPHIHACMLLTPKYQDAFISYLLSLKAKHFRDNNISTIDIKQFQDDGRGIEPMLTYSSKYAREQIFSSRFMDTLVAYPDVDAKKYPFYKMQD